MATLDSNEMNLISLLRSRLTDLSLKDEQTLDIFLVRWLRAWEGNLKQAEAMLRQSLKWREENDMDNILNWSPPDELLQMCPSEFLGFDSENSPVTYIPFGKWNVKKIVQSGETGAFVKYIDQLFERSVEKMKGKFTLSGLPVTQAVYIADAEQLSMKTLASVGAVDMILQCVKRFEGNNPETLRGMYILNAGTVFATLFSLIKPLLSRRTFGKMKIFRSLSPKCMEVLQSQIPLSVLPPRYGGTNKLSKDIYADGTPSASSTAVSSDSEAGYIAVLVPAADQLKLIFTVNEADSSICWAFKTDMHDIVFSVLSVDNICVHRSRVNSHESLQKGKVICDAAGDYVFIFDNTYSRLRAKALVYKIDIYTPKGVKQVSFH